MKKILILLLLLAIPSLVQAQQPMNLFQVAGTGTDTNSGNKSAGTIRVVFATDQPSNTNPFGINLTQLIGTTVDVNSGTKSAGTIRVILATDQPQLTNKLLVTPDSVALPANQSVNVNQLAGTTTDVNSGNKSAGTLRVVIATDQPALTNKLLVTPDSVALPANQSVNINQVNGAAIASADASSYLITSIAATATQNAGTSTCYITSAASTNSTNCKGSAGSVYEIHVTNTTTTNYFLRLYNLSSAPTCSSATGFIETVPALGAAANGGVNGRLNGVPQAYGTGIGFCLTGGGSSTDNTNAATGVYVTILYK